MATRFVYIVTDKDFSILTLCFICLVQSFDFLCFLCLSPDVVFAERHEVALCVKQDMDGRELAL